MPPVPPSPAVDASCGRRGHATPSPRFARRDTTPSRRGRWASACSTTPPSPRCMPARAWVSSESRWSISTCTTATAPRRCSPPNPDLFYASSHQHPCYPGTGDGWERGIANNIVNVPLRPGSDGAAFRAAWAGTILPGAGRFAPALLDHLRGVRRPCRAIRWRSSGWRPTIMPGSPSSCVAPWPTLHCGGRIVSVLEGGYDLDALAASAAAHVRGLMRA